MWNKWRALIAGLLLVGLAGPSFAQIELKIGSVTVPPTSISGGGCIQVPIFINDPDMSNRDLRDITFTVELTDDSGVIVGGIAANVTVANGFAGADVTGIRNPGVDLVNANAGPSPTCGAVFNQATQGSGPAVDFEANINNFAIWNINNNQGGAGRKQGFLIDLFNNAQIGGTIQNTDQLIAVLEIPIIAAPGQAQILVTATPVAMVAGGNTYTWDDGLRTDPQGNRIQIVEDFVLPSEPATVNIFDPVDCAGASTTPTEITWADPNDGGIGGALSFTFPGTSLADQVNLAGDGIDVDIPSGGATTMYAIDTANDASPDPDGNPTYVATYEVEFPPASGTFVGGATCNLNPTWAAASCSPAWSTQPVFGGDTDFNVTLTNARWDGTKYGNVTGPNGVNVDLVSPDAGAGTNTLTFNSVFSIVNIDNTDVGTYTVTGIGPGGPAFGGGGPVYSCDLVLTLDPPVNNTVCANITEASIEGSVDIDLMGNLGVVDYTVVYDGTTYDNLPGGVFSLPNINADATSILIQANGFDNGGNPTSDDITCDINYALPTCVATQDPVGTVDVGTVITLFLDTTNAVAADINGTPMTPDVDPNNFFNVQWSATHVAVADTIVNATVTNADGETTTCSWTIDINCIDPIILDVASVGDTGITIYGTFDCTYTVRITQHNTGQVDDYDVLIDTLVVPALSEGTGYLDVVIPPDAWIEVGQQGFPSATDMVPTVPTLGEWGMIAFIMCLLGAGLFVMRKRSLV
jgi:hypothetical protein